MAILEEAAIREAYTGDFKALLAGEWKVWRQNYLNHVRRVQTADRQEWMTSQFQELLWDSDAITTIGPGRSVTVQGAYGDELLASELFDANKRARDGTQEERGLALQSLFD